jgi:hypothetical protein
MSTTNFAPFLPRDPCSLPMLESLGSYTVATPAALEFALLEAWLASTGALQLPLHEVESQQQTKGREVQRLLLQAHIERPRSPLASTAPSGEKARMLIVDRP